MADKVLDIKEVPHSPGTSWDLTEIYNPLDEPFTWTLHGKPYTIPAKSKATFPEFQARLFAKHLARKIVYSNAYEEIEEAAKGQINPDKAKAVPVKRVDIMLEWILKPRGASPEIISGEKPVVNPSETKLTDELTEKEKEVLANYHKKVENLAKVREARKE